jgi:hypothetical protein
MFKNFMDNAYRCSDLDDCLLWTLHRQAAIDEYRLGGGDKTIAKGFDDLWTSFGQKYRDLIKELGAAPVAEEKDPKPKKKARPTSGVPDAKEPANAKETTKPKSKAKAKPKPKARDPSSSSSAAAPPSTATADDDADAPDAPEASGAAGVAHSGLHNQQASHNQVLLIQALQALHIQALHIQLQRIPALHTQVLQRRRFHLLAVLNRKRKRSSKRRRTHDLQHGILEARVNCQTRSGRRKQRKRRRQRLGSSSPLEVCRIWQALWVVLLEGRKDLPMFTAWQRNGQ